ncbi:Uncharacterised protein [Helicobacter cholecystus]|nr:Uncharacterised protein [Helicobacter cholecystus]
MVITFLFYVGIIAVRLQELILYLVGIHPFIESMKEYQG